MIKSLAYSFKEANKQISRNKLMSMLSILSIASMLFILGLFFFLTVNVNYTTENIKDQFDTIEVFLEDSTTKSMADDISESLSSMREVDGIEYITKQQAMDEFKKRWGENAYLLDSLESNPLPNSLRVSLTSLEGGSLVAEIARTMDGVEDVRYYQSEVNKILDLSNALQKGAMIFIIILVLVSIVVVSNTVKLTVLARQEEIQIMKFVGATNWFVRGPFLLEGMIMGFISAVISLGVTAFIYIKIDEYMGTQMLSLFSSALVEPRFMIINLAWIFMALGISIGAFGSIISMRRFLKV